jgi:GNAT superfamily N-acetyltransferase
MQPPQLRGYAESVVLRDVASLILRSVRPSDKPLLVQLFGRLSPQSIHSRAFGGKRTLTDQELSYLTEPDFAVHVPLAAVVRTEETGERIVGVGRYIRVDADRTPAPSSPQAEVAFAVEDAFQGRGIGTLLLEHLTEIARTSGVERMAAEMPASNSQMLQVFAESGFVVRRDLEADVYHVTFPIDATEAFVQIANTRSAGENTRSASKSATSSV